MGRTKEQVLEVVTEPAAPIDLEVSVEASPELVAESHRMRTLLVLLLMLAGVGAVVAVILNRRR